MSSCIRCGSPYASFGLYCSSCQTVDQLKKQNDLLESNSSNSSNEYRQVSDSERKIATAVVVGFLLLPVIFWDSTPMLIIRGIIVTLLR